MLDQQVVTPVAESRCSLKEDTTRSFIAPLEGSPTTGAQLPAPQPAELSELTQKDSLEDIYGIIRALDSPLRIRIMLALYERPHFVYELVELLGSSQPLVSQHLKVLKSARLVDSRRQGRQMIYSTADPHIIEILRLAFRAARHGSG